jgi:hypothetical protein
VVHLAAGTASCAPNSRLVELVSQQYREHVVVTMTNMRLSCMAAGISQATVHHTAATAHAAQLRPRA